ncbi:MAG TPA: acetyl-CoA carboxylase carboxyl transferase subunit alpha, partial [Sutterella sp.]|nr:acetyl-CoA carboxylase carboxyl transferase subunit alpha [Sutterella sp.]
DGIVPEPAGGAHRDPAQAAKALKKTLVSALKSLQGIEVETLVEERLTKWRQFGRFAIEESPTPTNPEKVS